LLERPQSGERCLLLHVGVKRRCYDDEIAEFRALAFSAGAQVVGDIQARRDRPDPRLFVGQGKAEELVTQIRESCAELVLVNQPMTASQERNLENFLKTRVLDRNGLILDIFAQRAASFEGKLQVELAQLEHLASRLVKGWTHLERQKGGIGLRGPGETQLETDRRLINQRIKRLKIRLGRVVNQRELGRRERRKARVPTVALVGYTNAGKSSLFNALSGANSGTRQQLFSTLDPTIRRLCFDGVDEVLLVDTVGFVRDLPHELVASFRSTLTETREASLLLHVIDFSDPHHGDRKHQVEGVLESIGASEVPCIQVYNKIDLAHEHHPNRELNGSQQPKVWVSATTGEGLGLLSRLVQAQCLGSLVSGQVVLSPNQSRLRARLFALKAVRGEWQHDSGGWTLDIEVTSRRWEQFCKQEGLSKDGFLEEA